MLARSVFELAVDIKLIDLIPNTPEKIITFSDVEKLRAARKITAFKTKNPNAAVDVAAHDSFIKIYEPRINVQRQRLWPSLKRLDHWSGLNLRERVERLKAPFDQIYEVNYPQLSWSVHSGLTSVVNLKAETFTTMCGVAFSLMGESYSEVLRTVIREFKIQKVEKEIEKKLNLAKLLPFADSAEQAD